MPLSEPLQRFLISYGYSPEQTASFERSTRLYHDLGWHGDSFDEDVGAIIRHFNIRISATRRGPHYPGTWTWDHFITTFLGWTPLARRTKDKYKPISFGTIEDAIAKGVWDSD